MADRHRREARGRVRSVARRRWLLPAVGVIVVIVALAAALALKTPSTATAQTCTQGKAMGLAVGQCAPDFTLKDLRDANVSLAAYRGHPVLIHFWAVGCPTCAGEYPDFSRIVRQYRSRGLVVLAVDAWGEPKPLIAQWQSSHHLPATILVDVPTAVYNLYHGEGTPTSYFIDRRGRITYSMSGPLSYAQYQQHLAKII